MVEMEHHGTSWTARLLLELEEVLLRHREAMGQTTLAAVGVAALQAAIEAACKCVAG
jgi:hypothetical protein